MGWSGLSDDHHERGEITDLTHEGYRLLHTLITSTAGAQKCGHFTQLDAAGLARLHGITDVTAALEDLLKLRSGRPHIEGDAEHGYRLINEEQYHITPSQSIAGQRSAALGRPQENGKKGGRPRGGNQRKPTETNGAQNGNQRKPTSPSPSGVLSTPPFVPQVGVLQTPIEPGNFPGLEWEIVYTWAEGHRLTVDDREEVDLELRATELPADEVIAQLNTAVDRGKTPNDGKLMTLLHYIQTSQNGTGPGSMVGRALNG